MKKLIIILTIDFIVVGFVLFLVFQPTPQTAEQGSGNSIIRDYVYPAVNNSIKKTEQVSLPGVLVTAKNVNNATAAVVKPKHNVSYKIKHSKLKTYKFFSKNKFPVTWYNSLAGHSSNDPDPLKLNANNVSYTNKSANINKVSANY